MADVFIPSVLAAASVPVATQVGLEEELARAIRNAFIQQAVAGVGRRTLPPVGPLASSPPPPIFAGAPLSAYTPSFRRAGVPVLPMSSPSPTTPIEQLLALLMR